MVGRARELHRLREAFSQAVDDRSCQLFTILGQAGMGKSRLAHEFLSSSVDATVIVGRCLSYGEGITYWPVVEAVLQLVPGDRDAASQICDLLPDSLAASAITSLIREESAATSTEETAWAFRKLLEAAAVERPIVCVFDDIHWGEPTFLDLIEHVADMSRGAPILLLCLARPELLDRRPAWGGGKLNVTTVLLEPLGDDETDRLIEELVADLSMPEALREKIRESAEGNPLFVEEMLALVQESGEGEITVPPTIHALLAARLDQLEPRERAVLERGSIEGRVFHTGAVQALAPEEREVPARLTSLVRKELVRPDTPQFAGEDAFRFRHLLIRDAAYDGLPKALRAALHEQFADWLEARGRDLIEFDEIAGYHLEQAFLYLSQLGPVDEHGRDLAARAAQRLFSAGEKAIRARADLAAAVNLLDRGSSLLPEDAALRLDAQSLLGSALMDAGQIGRAEEVLEALLRVSTETRHELIRADAAISFLLVRNQNDPTFGIARVRDEVRQALEIAERLGDDRLLARGWCELGKVEMWLGRFADGEQALARSLELADRARDRRRRQVVLGWLALMGTWGPLPTDHVIRRNEQIWRDPDATSDLQARAVISSAFMKAMQGRFEEARADAAQGRAQLRELGHELTWAGTTMITAEVESLADDPAAAEQELRPAYETLAHMGETAFLSTVAAYLADALCQQGRIDEALALTEVSERTAADDDFESQAAWRSVRARILAARGEFDEAERLAREAVSILEPTDSLPSKTKGAVALADVLCLAGRPREAIPQLEDAIRFAEQKGDLVTAAKTHAKLDRALSYA